MRSIFAHRIVDQRSATLLKGAKSADLAMEQPSKLELAVNVQAANALPPSLVLRLDEVIRDCLRA